MDLILAPLQYQFMQHALLELLLLAVLTSIVGAFVVVRNLTFAAEALTHGVLPGLVLGYITGIPAFVGALASGLFTAVLMAVYGQGRKLRSGVITGVILTTALALGVLLLSSLRNYKANLTDLLFGNILAVSASDLLTTALVLVIALLALAYWGRKLLLVSTDYEFARGMGLRVGAYDLLLYVLIAGTVVVASQAVGNLLVLALATLPPASARLLSRNFSGMLVRAVIISLAVSVLGLYFTYYFDLATGATIVIMHFIVFCCCGLFARETGAIRPRSL